MSHVQELAELPCPGIEIEPGVYSGCKPCISDDCPTCHGTGALVAELWKRVRCPSLYVDWRCGSCGDIRHCQHCEACHGARKIWALKPLAEQMGVLVRVRDGITVYKIWNKWHAKLPFEGTNGIWGKGDTPEEALASAILQVIKFNNTA